ncbi:PilZ domain-containing protein [Thermosipho ferrireducens]|uniref:PilZ domain-containing protein n=1 Tax=Thermosipho ferrireducens TaxID=2571116 RepID=A0ABX7S5L6_9BACT|nr:PilZ domain-containing protein [Thermosipho ferrireducens]QTA37841.1 PilZ domain-containing protein [Thermosipho ferrireducens]
MAYVTLVEAKKVLKIGLPGIIDITMSKELEGSYKTNVSDIDLNKNILFLSIPTFKGRFIPIPKGIRMSIRIFDKSSLYTFDTVSLGVIKRDNLYMIPVPIPEKLRKTERRRFARIPLYIYGSFKLSPEKDAEKISFMTKDFSAGGMKITTNYVLHINDIIYVNLKLDDELELVDWKSKVVRVDPKEEEGFSYGVQFLDLPMYLESKLVRFVFQKEVKMRKAK